MTEHTTFSVVQLGEFPATRNVGRDGRGRLEDILESTKGVDLAIDFAGVTSMTISFADEFLGKFLSTVDFAEHNTTVKVTGLNPDNYFSVEVCVERRGCLVVALEESGALALLGADSIMRETFEASMNLGAFKAAKLAEDLDLTPSNANNRLKRLAQAGALRRTQVTGSARGGKEFLYEVVPSTVVGAPPLAPA